MVSETLVEKTKVCHNWKQSETLETLLLYTEETYKLCRHLQLPEVVHRLDYVADDLRGWQLQAVDAVGAGVLARQQTHSPDRWKRQYSQTSKPPKYGGGESGLNRLSATEGHITDCKLDSVVYASVCRCRCGDLDQSCLGWMIYARPFLGCQGNDSLLPHVSRNHWDHYTDSEPASQLPNSLVPSTNPSLLQPKQML